MRALFLFAPMLALSCASSAPTTSSPASAASPITLTYLGVAGWKVESTGAVLLVDPYFSRYSVEHDDVPLVPDAAAIARYAPGKADVILVEHSHYDHLLDVPVIATQTGATVLGTESTAHVLQAFHVDPSHVLVAHPGDSFDRPPFAIRAIHGLHSDTGQTHAEIPVAVTWPLTAAQFTEGGTLDYLVHVDGHDVLFIGSANFDEASLVGLHPDVAVLAVGLRAPDYACRLMKLLGAPPLVYTDHFDAHREPLGSVKALDLDPESKADLAAFANEIHACAPNTKVIVPKHFAPMTL